MQINLRVRPVPPTGARPGHTTHPWMDLTGYIFLLSSVYKTSEPRKIDLKNKAQAICQETRAVRSIFYDYSRTIEIVRVFLQ